MPEVDAWPAALAASPWAFLILYAFTTIDGFFPPVPSESVVTIMAAAVTWSAYSVVIGVGAGHLLEEHHPLVGVVVGVTGGLLTGALMDCVLQRLRPARRGRPTAATRCPAATPCRCGAGDRDVTTR